MSLDPKTLFVAVPTRGQVSSCVVEKLDQLRDLHGFDRVLYEPGRMSVSDVRNRIVRLFLKSSKEWLLMIDDDVIPHTNVLTMFEHGKPIIAAPYFMLRPPLNMPFPCVFEWNDRIKGYTPQSRPYGRRGIEQVAAAGTGCMGIHREILERPEFQIPFKHGTDEHGILKMTEDVYFCREATKAGLEVWVDWDVQADHYVSGISLNATFAGFANAYEQVMKKEPIVWAP